MSEGGSDDYKFIDHDEYANGNDMELNIPVPL